MRFLIVENDATARQMLRRLLSVYGAVEVVSNGHQALEAVMAAIEDLNPYDLVSLEVKLPELDGLTTLRHIRQLEAQHSFVTGRGAKVIMAAAVRDPRTVINLFREQADGFLFKPFEPQALAELLWRFGLVVPPRFHAPQAYATACAA